MENKEKTSDDVIKEMVDLTHELENEEKFLQGKLNLVKQKLCFLRNLSNSDFIKFMGTLFEIMKKYMEMEKEDGKKE